MTKKNHNFLCCSLRKNMFSFTALICTSIIFQHHELEKNEVSCQDIEAKNKEKMGVMTQ